MCKNSSLRDDSEEVLLVENRRRTYDRIHSTLKEIGTLRACLGLNHANNWLAGTEVHDYTQSSNRKHSAYEEFQRKAQTKYKKIYRTSNSSNKFITNAFCVLLAFIIPFIILFIMPFIISGIFLNEADNTRTATSSNPSSPAPSFSEPVLPMPQNGTIRRHTNAHGVAGLKIQTSEGSNYLLKLENISTGKNIMDIFILGGHTITVEVPLGRYRIKYAAGGPTWYGYEYNFGPGTAYSKADEVFNFYQTEYEISGYELTLYPVLGGNLRTSRIDPSQF